MLVPAVALLRHARLAPRVVRGRRAAGAAANRASSERARGRSCSSTARARWTTSRCARTSATSSRAPAMRCSPTAASPATRWCRATRSARRRTSTGCCASSSSTAASTAGASPSWARARPISPLYRRFGLRSVVSRRRGRPALRPVHARGGAQERPLGGHAGRARVHASGCCARPTPRASCATRSTSCASAGGTGRTSADSRWSSAAACAARTRSCCSRSPSPTMAGRSGSCGSCPASATRPAGRWT